MAALYLSQQQESCYIPSYYAVDNKFLVFSLVFPAPKGAYLMLVNGIRPHRTARTISRKVPQTDIVRQQHPFPPHRVGRSSTARRSGRNSPTAWGAPRLLPHARRKPGRSRRRKEPKEDTGAGAGTATAAHQAAGATGTAAERGGSQGDAGARRQARTAHPRRAARSQTRAHAPTPAQLPPGLARPRFSGGARTGARRNATARPHTHQATLKQQPPRGQRRGGTSATIRIKGRRGSARKCARCLRRPRRIPFKSRAQGAQCARARDNRARTPPPGAERTRQAAHTAPPLELLQQHRNAPKKPPLSPQ